MNEIDPTGLLRAENAELRRELEKAGRLLKQLVERCRGLDETVDHMAGHMALMIERQGGSVVITETDRELTADRVVKGYRTESLEDNRERFFTLTPEEYEDQRRRQEAVDDAAKQGGGPGLRIIEP